MSASVTHRGRLAQLALSALLATALVLTCAQAAGAYTFGSTVAPTGAEQTVYDWSTMACEPLDIPDTPARAFRDSSGHVQLLGTHFINRRMIGPSLDDLRHDCRVVMNSERDSDPSHYQDREWLAAPYTEDGSTVYALASHEYQGYQHPGACPSPYTFRNCWQNSITLAVSTDDGNSYAHLPSTSALVASVPYVYTPGNPDPYGVFSPSNVIRKPDGYYYTMVHTTQYGLQQAGVCLLRTDDLADAQSWRAWDGAGFTTDFADPYADPPPSPDAHVCQPVAQSQITTMTDSLTYNTYFGKYLLIGATEAVDPISGNTVRGFYYSLSNDLITWTGRKLLIQAVLPWAHTCSDEDPLIDASILDPDSGSRNFDTNDQNPYLYFVRQHYLVNGSSCFQLLDRDLARVPFQFTGPGAAAAAASFTPSTSIAQPGSAVEFDASSTRTVDDSRASYRWDLDGDGSFESNTGHLPRVKRSYDRAGSVTVRLRVTDELGDRMDTARRLEVGACAGKGPPCKSKCRGHGRRSCATGDHRP
jgi:hypothetical protein